MRKKYLSALLFGALLLASAGTFTSCKDYDDDIKNLQEQINTVKTSLDELTTKVNNLGAGIKDFKYENGQLVIVTDKDTNFTVDLPACEGITNLEIKDGVLYADGKAVGNVSGDGGSVVKVEDGVIYIDGEAVAEVGNKVAIVDNGNGTYTLTVDGKEYVLPKSVAADVTVTAYNVLFSEFGKTWYDESEQGAGGIYWGVAAKDASWDGPKGAVKAGQFLVGTISTPTVTVTPATTELDKMNLKLVDSEGVYAPVTIEASPVSGDTQNSGSRATSAAGKWMLKIAMDETVTADNAGDVFTTTTANNEVFNKRFALSADGRLLSGYQFIIDTQEKVAKTEDVEAALKKYDWNLMYVDGKAVGTNQIEELSMESSIQLAYNHPQVYDYKYTIAARDVNDAEKAGITLENNVLKGASTAANKGVFLDLTVMGVNGVTYTYESALWVKFTNTVVDSEELAETAYKVPVDSKTQAVVIDLENTFSGLSAAEAVSLTQAVWSLAPGEENTYLADKSNLGTVKYYSDAECKNEVSFNDSKDNVKNIKFAKITFNTYNTAATTGVHKLQLTLVAGKDEVKKVIAPVNVTVPTFDEMFTKSAAWNEGVAQLRLTYKGVAKAMTLYKTAEGFKSEYAQIKYDQVDNETIIDDRLEAMIYGTIVNDNYGLKSTKAELSYKFAGVEGFTVKSGKFDVNFMSYMEGATIKNFGGDKGAEIAFEVSGDNEVFEAATLVLNDLKSTKGMLGQFGEAMLYKQFYKLEFDAKAGDKAVAEIDEESGALKVSGLAVGKYETTLTVIYKVAVSTTEFVYVTMPVKLTVNNN